MNLTPKIQKAINTAARLHNGQTRKGDDLPYILHPFSVAWILSNYTADEDVICAGLLHDVLEDVRGYGKEEMIHDFGPRVYELVKGVSEDKDPHVETDPTSSEIRRASEKATWEDRKRGYLEHLKTCDADTVLISVADKLHNAQSMLAAYEEQGDALWKKFNAPMEKRVWFFEEVLRIANEKLPGSELIKIYEMVIDDLKSKIDMDTNLLRN